MRTGRRINKENCRQRNILGKISEIEIEERRKPRREGRKEGRKPRREGRKEAKEGR